MLRIYDEIELYSYFSRSIVEALRVVRDEERRIKKIIRINDV